MTVTRADGRAYDELRPVRITRAFTDVPEGSVLIECGNTRVMCTATFTDTVPRWRKDSGLGWVTAEYSMLPRATSQRTDRESVRGKIGGRTHEISRLIGRCLRGVIDMKALGENTIQMDCDVLQADGGTRTASITGAYVALVDALNWAKQNGKIKSVKNVLLDSVSAVSVGVIDGEPMLDLPYVEDSRAMTDMNVAMTGNWWRFATFWPRNSAMARTTLSSSPQARSGCRTRWRPASLSRRTRCSRRASWRS